jgi:hypothetical protein
MPMPTVWRAEGNMRRHAGMLVDPDCAGFDPSCGFVGTLQALRERPTPAFDMKVCS